MFRCADTVEEANDGLPVRYYESVDLVDAVHLQTILAYEMNGAPLSVQHGAPLRLRVERQLGYKMTKYVTVVEVVARIDGVSGGNGGYWEDNGAGTRLGLIQEARRWRRKSKRRSGLRRRCSTSRERSMV